MGEGEEEVAMDGVRVLPDRRPRYSLWVQGRPLSSQSDNATARGYIERVQSEARRQVHGPPLDSTTTDVEIIFPTRGAALDVDNAPKRIIDALKGIVYESDAQIRAVKSVGLRLDQGFRARGSPDVYKRLLAGKEFLVNVYEGERETDVYLVDASTPETEKPSVLMLSIARPTTC